MDSDRLNRWLTLGANLAVLVGIALLVVELRQNQDIVRAQTRNEITQGELALLLSTAENSELADIVVRANNGEELSEVEYLRYILRSESTFRLWQNVHYQGRNGNYDAVEYNKHLETVGMVLGENPGLVAYWCNTRNVYPTEFVDRINALMPAESCN